jgi:phosphoribosylformylglycinamidine cyclo-ligase
LTPTYESAGVSLARAEDVVERLRAAVESTGARGFGAFAGLYPLDGRRFLAASTDGVGTKLVLARDRGALRACGADLAAHCINDVLTTGAEPLFLLDYVAANELDLEQVAELVEGAAEVCRAAGVALVGGETAELPANGFTLVRRVLEREDYDGDDLLAPTRLYLDDARRLRPRAHAFAHVTGGGIEDNLARVVPERLSARIDWEAWERPPVFAWLARHVDELELRRVFNLGLGYLAVVAEPEPGDLVVGHVERA